MTTVDQFLNALAITESDDNPEAWGDGGFAMGRWQVYPDRLWQEIRTSGIAPRVGETWDQLVARILRSIFRAHTPAASPVSIAMYWHLGHWAATLDDDWDSSYEVRFTAALARAIAEVP